MSERNDGELKMSDLGPRDYFAIFAMQGLLASDPKFSTEHSQDVADAAFMMADAMLKAREA